MPQINRIRVNNIKYNFGTQYYDDFFMRFSCRNSLYDLANGGGKSVLMLLLMQNLIPNCTLDDKQPVEKLFRSGNGNTVIHSLVEWKLDACDVRDGFRYMTTGFCARKGKDGGEEERRDTETASIEYFNYCIFYKEFGENDIKNLPLVVDGERVSYGGLKAYLRGLEKDSGLEIRIFDRKGDYQNFISGYGLYESQWEIVRGINRTEGHVRAYFENSYKTTRRVIEDLLIEEIIEKSYNNRIRRGVSDGDEMAQTLLDIKDKLIELSKRREEMHNYDRQTELLSGFGCGLEELRALYAEKQRAEDRLIRCLVSCRAMLEDKKVQALELAKQGEELDKAYRRAAKAAALAELEIEFAELDGVIKLIDEAAAGRLEAMAVRDELSERLKLCGAAADYGDYVEYRHKYEEIKELLNSGDAGQKELLEELGSLAAARLEYVEKESAALEESARSSRIAAESAYAAYEKAKEDEQRLFAGINSQKGIETGLADRIKKTEEELDGLMAGLGILTSDGAGALLEENRKQADKAAARIGDIEKAMERSRSKQIELGRRQAELSALISNSADETGRLEDELSQAFESEEKQGRLMEIYGVSDSALLAETVEYIYNGLTGEKISAVRELDRLTSYCASIRKRRLPEYDTGYETVLSYLKGRYGADVMSGREFIESMTKEEAAQAAERFPLLPYTIVTAEAVYETVAGDKVLNSMNTGSYVIPIISAGSWQDGIKYAAAYKDMGFLWDDAALASEIEKTNEDIARLEEDIKRLEGKREVARNDLAQAQLLCQSRSSSSVREKIFRVKNQISVYNGQLEETVNEEKMCADSLAEQKNELDTERGRIEELNRAFHIYSHIKELNEAAEAISAELAAGVNSRKESEKEYGRVKAKLNESLRQAEENSAKAKESAQRLEKLRQDFADNFKPYLIQGAAPALNMTQEQIDARAGALRSLLGEGRGDAADKERLLAAYEDSMQKCGQKLLYAGFEIAEAEKLYKEGKLISGSVDEMLKLKSELAALDGRLAGFEAKLDEQNALKNRIEGSLSHGRRRYEEQFGAFARENMENPQGAVLKYRREMSAIKGRRAELERRLKELENSSRDGLLMERDMERLVRNAGLTVPKHTENAAEGIKLTPETYEEIWRGYERVLSDENRLKTKFYKDKQTLAEELDKCHAYELAREIRSAVGLPTDIGALDEMLKGLSDTGECIALEKDRIEKTVSDMERIKDSFENRCVQICANIRTELERFPKLSRITLEDEVIPIVTLSVPYIKEEMYKERMSVYINETVSGAETFEDRESKLRYIRGRLSWKKLFSVIVKDMNSIKLCLYKREHIKDQSRYLRYEEAVGSTGQSQGIYIQFLIAVINYIASINSSGKDTSVTGKTIFIDNPFGAAKDVYIWEPIFKMLATNHVQLIVPARGVTPAITRMFDVNYVLGQKFTSGRQQTVVTDYRSQVRTGEMDYTKLEFEQAAFDFL